MIAAIDDGDADRGPGERLGRVQSTETAANDDDVRRMRKLRYTRDERRRRRGPPTVPLSRRSRNAWCRTRGRERAGHSKPGEVTESPALFHAATPVGTRGTQVARAGHDDDEPMARVGARIPRAVWRDRSVAGGRVVLVTAGATMRRKGVISGARTTGSTRSRSSVPRRTWWNLRADALFRTSTGGGAESSWSSRLVVVVSRWSQSRVTVGVTVSSRSRKSSRGP